VSTNLNPPATQEQADSQEVARLIAGGHKVSDPELRRRIRARAEKVRREILEKHGVVEWAVDMIRDARDEQGGFQTPRDSPRSHGDEDTRISLTG
jgi:hypothetical protein